MKEQIAHLRALGDKRDTLLLELDRCLAIQALVPDAFAHGACKSYVLGAPASGFRFIVERGDGSKVDFPVKEVPPELCAGFLAWAKQKGKA
jgi:hypothetical protein